MYYNRFQNIELSALGLGCMRLPVIDGDEIMAMFHLQPSREVGELKTAMKDAILDNTVPNEREALLQLLQKKAQEMGIGQNR